MSGSTRRGLTMVEAIMGALVAAIVLGIAWNLVGSVQRQAVLVERYASVFQTAGALTARLQTDLAAAFVPPAVDPVGSSFLLGDGGSSLGFLRYERVDDVTTVRPTSPPLVWVEWSSRPGPEGSRILTRKVQEGETIEWPDAPATQVRFELLKHRGYLYAVGAFLLKNAEAVERGGAFAGRSVPVRIVRRLSPPAVLVPTSLSELPGSLVAALPPETPLVPEDASIALEVELELGP